MSDDAPDSAARAPRLALPALVLGGLAVGCAPILVRVSEVGPFATAFWRLAFALVPLLVFALAAERSRGGGVRRPRSLSGALVVAAPGLFLGAELAVWHVSLHMTSVANATLLVNMTPIFTALASWAFLRRAVSRAFGAGLALAVVGVLVLKSGPAAARDGALSGDVLALLAAMLYAGYFLLLGHARKSYATTTIMLASTASAALVTLPLALLDPAFAPVSLLGWTALLALAWIVQATGQGLVTFAIAWLPPTFSSLTMLIQPIVAAALAWRFLDEPLSGLQMAGGVLVVAGIAAARRG